MGNIIIADSALSDAATLTAGSEAAGMPVGNLQTFQPSEKWRATNLAAAYVEADLGAAQPLDLIALLYTNTTSAATWRIRGATTQANLTAAPGYDSGAITAWPQSGLDDWDFVHVFKWLGASPQTFRWWRVDLTDAANPDGHLQAGRLYLSDAWQPARNLQYGWSIGFADDSIKRRATGGQSWVTARGKRRVLDFTLGFLSEAEMYDNAFDIDRRRGEHADVLAIRDPDDTAHVHRQMVYGLIDGLKPIVNPNFNLFEKSYRIEEAL